MDFKCTQCEKNYRSKMALSNHKRLIHGNPKVHSCIQCEYTTKIKRDCNMHIRSIHEKIQEECLECGKKYSKETLTCPKLLYNFYGYLNTRPVSFTP